VGHNTQDLRFRSNCPSHVDKRSDTVPTKNPSLVLTIWLANSSKPWRPAKPGGNARHSRGKASQAIFLHGCSMKP